MTHYTSYTGFLQASGGMGGAFINVFFFGGQVIACCDPLTGVQTNFDVTLGGTTQHYVLPPGGTFELSAPITFEKPILFAMDLHAFAAGLRGQSAAELSVSRTKITLTDVNGNALAGIVSDLSDVPEPATLCMTAVALIGIAVAGRRAEPASRSEHGRW